MAKILTVFLLSQTATNLSWMVYSGFVPAPPAIITIMATVAALIVMFANWAKKHWDD